MLKTLRSSVAACALAAALAGPATAQETPTPGGSIVITYKDDVATLDPAIGYDWQNWSMIKSIFDGLMDYVPGTTDLRPGLAESYEISEDGLVWTLNLNTNATFQPGGKKLTADDVVFTYQLSNSKNCRFNPSVCLAFVPVDATPDVADDENVPVLKSVEKVDDDTVRFTLAAPYAPFATTTLPGTFIDSKEAVEAAYAAFQQTSGAVPDAEITALNDKITAEQAKEEADLVQFRGELEALLGRTGVDVPQADPRLYPGTDDAGAPNGQLDEASYVTALVQVLTDLATSRAQQGIDAIAAAYPILSISRKPVGTGPFYVTNFLPGERIELKRNEGYHNGVPALEGMFIPIITDDIAGAQALSAGQIDWKYSMAAQAYAAVKDNPNVKIAEYADFGYFGLQFNLREGKLFADKALRQAVAYCVQKEQIVEAATEGQGVPIYATIPPASWAYNTEVEKFPHDIAKGIALIEGAGWTKGSDGVYEKDGKRLETTVLVRAGRPDRIKFMQLLSDQLNANCGFDMEIQEADFGTVLSPMLEWPHAQQGKTGNEVGKQFDAYFGGWGSGFDPDPYAIWHSSQCTTKEQPATYNYICYNNPEADKLIEDGLRELDQAKRAEIYKQFEAIVAEDVPYLFAWSDRAREGVNANVNGAEQWTAENMKSPTWFYRVEKITKTAQ